MRPRAFGHDVRGAVAQVEAPQRQIVGISDSGINSRGGRQMPRLE